MLDYNNTILAKIDAGQKQATADAERAQALQADPTFWEPGEQIDKHTHLPLWHVICAFKGMNPAHWALSSPDQAGTMQRHTIGDVSDRLKVLVRLHGKALGHAMAGSLKGFGDTAKDFKTTVQDLTEWAEKVGEMRSEPHPTKSAADPQIDCKDLDAATEKPLPSWLCETRNYIAGVMSDGKYGTAKELYKALETKAGPESPFEKGTDSNRDKLFVRAIHCHISVKTMQNNWRLLRSLT